MYADDLLIVKFAKEDAKKEGRAEVKTEVVISMLDNGLDVETTAKYTKLSVDEVEKIKESLVNSIIT